jgi:hypothetical protein
LDLPIGRKVLEVSAVFADGTRVRDAYSGKGSRGKIKIRTDFDIVTGKKINIHSYTKARIDSGLCFYYNYLFTKNQSNAKIGHRGARGYEPENTLIGFQKQLTYRWMALN